MGLKLLMDGLDTQFSTILEGLFTFSMMISFLKMSEFVHVIIQLEQLIFGLQVLTDGLVHSRFIDSQQDKPLLLIVRLVRRSTRIQA
jgi:hypothetical protein